MHPRLLVAALVALACTPDFTIPPGAQISCDADADCPGGFRCNSDTQLCVNLQESPPVVSPTLVGPSDQTAVKGGDALTVSGTAEEGAAVVAVRLVNATTQAALQTVPPTAVVNTAGSLSGTFIAADLPDGASVAVEVTVQARGYRSIPENSRSLPVVVDATAPSNGSVALAAGGTVVSSRSVTLALSAVGASQMYLDGDLEDGEGVRTWIPYGTSATVTLAPGDGLKTVVVQFRDGAHNTLQRQAALNYDSTIPASRPTLTGPWTGVAKVKNSDAVTVGGTALAGAVVHAAVLRSLDAGGAPLAGAGCSVDVTSQVSLSGAGVLGGSLNIGTPCAGAASIDLEVIVRNGAGTQSIAAESRSNLLALDNQPPVPASGSFAAVPGARAGFTRFEAMTLQLGAELDGTVEVFIDGDVSAGRVRAWVPFPGNQTVPGEEPITLTAGNGPKTVTVRFRDELQNTTAAINVAINLDTTPPPPPVGNNLELVETSGAPNDPASVASANNTFTLTGLALALVDADRVELFSDAALTSSLGVLNGQANGRFPATVLPYNAAQSYYAQAIDAAGNRSTAATRATVPAVTPAGFTLPSVPGRSGVPFNFSFTLSVDLDAPPAVTVASRTATCAPPTGRTHTCSYTPDGTEPEGGNAVVVRVVARDGSGQMANTTVGTDATTFTLDFTPPTLAGASVTVAQNDPGSVDQISGAAGAVSDNLAASNFIGVRVYRADGTTLITTVSGTFEGAFPATSVGDNTNASVVIQLVDPAGNVSAGTAFSNDIAAPSLTGLVISPAAQHAGANVDVTFNVGDASDLRTLPSVTVASRAATHASGTPNTSDGATHPFGYSFAVLSSDAEQSHPVSVTARDRAGNATTVSGTVLFDHTPPSSANTTPGNRTTWNGSPGVLGSASDALSGVARVEVSLRSVTNNAYWNGAAFASSTETFLAATGSTAWSFSTSGIPFVTGQSYTLRWRAVDAAGNVESAGSGFSFTYDPTLPPAPASLTATSGAAVVSLSWAAASGASSYKVYYDAEAGTHPPYVGTGAVEGSSPIVVSGATTSLTVNGLPRGRYVFAITTVDGVGRESGYSPQAAAASRYWKWSRDAVTINSVNRMISPAPGRFIAVGDGPTAWVSSNSGATWRTMGMPGNTGDLVDVVATSNAVVAVGRTGIARSTDGGETWTFVTSHTLPSIGIFPIPRVAYATGSQLSIIASGANEILYSSDDGATFAPVNTTLTTAPRLIGGSGSRVVVFGAGQVSVSTDGGATFATAGAFGTACSTTAVYLNGLKGVVGCNTPEGGIRVTSNGGVNWNAVTPTAPLAGEVKLVFGLGDLMFGVDQNNGGTVSRSTDGGATWTNHLSMGVNLVTGWTNGTVVIVTGASNSYTRSTDGGANFTNNFNFPAAPGDFVGLAAQTLAFDGTTLAVGASNSLGGVEAHGTIAVSSNLGALWARPASSMAYGSNLARPWASGTALITADRNNGTIWRSADDGESWTKETSAGLASASMVGGNADAAIVGGYLTSGNCGLLRTTDGGATWTQVSSYSNSFGVPNSVAVRGQTWVVVTESGYALRSTNAGVTWGTPAAVVSGGNLRNIRAVGGGFVAVGRVGTSSGAIRRSTDDGLSWSTITSGTIAQLTELWTSPGLILVGGENLNGILRSVDDGATFASSTTTLTSTRSIVCSGATCVAGGINGDHHLVVSTDSGATWVQRSFSSALAPASLGVALVSVVGNRFYSVGLGQPRYSDDGGLTWLTSPALHSTPVPVSPNLKLTGAGLTASGMPIALTGGGTLVFGPP